jgi:hypothetical protein
MTASDETRITRALLRATGRAHVTVRTTLVALLLALAYAVGAATWNESIQALGSGDDHGILIAGFGGAVVFMLLIAAWIAGRRPPSSSGS